MLYIDGLNDIAILKAGAIVVVGLMLAIALLEPKENPQ